MNVPSKWLRYRPAIGLVIDQQQVAMSVVATTLAGRREIAHEPARMHCGFN